jgi:hypothetical protein
MKIVILVVIAFIATTVYSAQTTKTYNHVLGRRGARTAQWDQLTSFQDYKYTDYLLPSKNYNAVFSDSRQATCVLFPNDPNIVLGTKENVLIKRIYVHIKSENSVPCSFKVLVSNSASTKVSTTSIVDASSVIGRVEFPASVVNPQNERYIYYSFFSVTSNNEPCFICELEMFSG